MSERQYLKLCERDDFDDPELRGVLRSMAPGKAENEELHRKLWEYGMLGLYLEQTGALDARAEVLAVAAGQEPPLFWLANRVGRVVATDIYGEGRFGDEVAPTSMLGNPAAFAPFGYREDRLEVRHMDALALEYPDASFDIAFCLSSVEHFGPPANARRAALEMGRVLRPGGRLVITTECFVGWSPLDSPSVQFAIRLATLGRRCPAATPSKRMLDVFTAAEIRRWIVKPLTEAGVVLEQPMDLRFDSDNFENLTLWEGAGERLHPATGSFYPHIVLKAHGSPWTSLFLAFRKPR